MFVTTAFCGLVFKNIISNIRTKLLSISTMFRFAQTYLRDHKKIKITHNLAKSKWYDQKKRIQKNFQLDNMNHNDEKLACVFFLGKKKGGGIFHAHSIILNLWTFLCFYLFYAFMS